MQPGLDGRRVFVTGATRGIGLAIARAFRDAGTNVVAGCRDPGDVTIGTAHVCDLRAPTLPDGAIDILVNNAGIWQSTPVDSEVWATEWERVWQINVQGTAELCRQFAARAEPGSCIVNVSSRASHRGEAGYAAYAASKAAINALTKSLATELGPRGVRVNAVAPGWVVTDMTREALPADRLPEPIPLGRVADPVDVAGPVLFLASDWARFVTGIVLDVNGGAYLH